MAPVPDGPPPPDVLVLGSGASGLSCAVTAAHQGLRVLVAEKAALVGGTTARSGGWLWVPGTHLATEQGIHEPPGAARAYLQHEAGTHFDPALVDAFTRIAPRLYEELGYAAPAAAPVEAATPAP